MNKSKDIDNKDKNINKSVNTYGLKSFSCPQQVKGLILFENELFNLVNSVIFSRNCSKFQQRLMHDKDNQKHIHFPHVCQYTTICTTNMYKPSKG